MGLKAKSCAIHNLSNLDAELTKILANCCFNHNGEPLVNIIPFGKSVLIVWYEMERKECPK